MINDDYISAGEAGFTGAMLDDYLSSGYYRMQHSIFTTHFTCFDEQGKGSPVFWLRTKLNEIKENKTATGIRRKCAAFKVQYKRAVINSEHEALYQLYREYVNFAVATTCTKYLHADDCGNPYDSWMIEIRDADLLIAVGFFDKGKEAISGIMNFYRPSYNKYSLGKYLMLKKMDYALANHIPLYYTGYLSTAFTKFDYKLFPDKEAVEVYLPLERKWRRFNTFGKAGLEAYFWNYIL